MPGEWLEPVVVAPAAQLQNLASAAVASTLAAVSWTSTVVLAERWPSAVNVSQETMG